MAGACGTAGGPARVPAPPAPGTTGLTDADITAIVVAANDVEMLYAELALAKTHDAELLAFATMVRIDHAAMNGAADALVARLGIASSGNPISFDLRDGADARRTLFRDLEGFAFDSAYSSNEASYHRTMIGMLDATLLPSARRGELRSLLQSMRPALEAHLRHAESLAATRVSPSP
jgi:putative membrane protein